MLPARFVVDGQALAVGTFTGSSGVSSLFQYKLETGLAAEQPAMMQLLGKPFEAELVDDYGEALVIRGLVMSAERRTSSDGLVGLQLTLESSVAPLALGADCRLFQELSAVDIIKRVLDASSTPLGTIEWSISGDYPVRPYCVQYRESDWSFIERLLAEEGILYRFEHAKDDSKLVFFDSSSAVPALPGGAEIPFIDVSGERAARDCVYELGRRTQVVHEGAQLIDYNFETPQVALDATSGGTDRQWYDFPGRFQEQAQADRLAAVLLESLQAGRSVLSGKTTSARVRPGLKFELVDHPVASLNGAYIVCSVKRHCSGERSSARPATDEPVGAATETRFTAIGIDTPLRPNRSAIVMAPRGPQTGMVVGAAGEEIHPDDAGRIRIQHHWDREGARDDKAGTWMRVGQFALGGSMVIPRIGWQVLVHHHEGDIDAPHITSHLYDGQFRVPYALPDNKTRTAWQTATSPGDGSSNEIRFEDAAGSEELFMNAAKDMNVVVGDNKVENVGVDYCQDIGANLTVSVGGNHVRNVTSNQSVSIGASESLSVTGNRAISVDGSEDNTVGGSRSETALLGKKITAKGGRTLSVGGSMLDIAALGVNRVTLGTKSVTVGGSWISAAATGVGAATLGACAETVGAAKICAGAAGVETSVKGACAETVGGAYVIAAGGDAGEKATGPLAITVGGAFLANAPKIEIEADSKISIRAGGSTLTITSSSIEVKAPTILAPAGGIKKKASTIKHN